MLLLTPYPPRTPLLEGAGNVPWSLWFSTLVRTVNALIRDLELAQAALAGASVGLGDPNGQIVGDVGDTFRRRDGGAGSSWYVKESGAGTAAGWVAK